MRPLAVLLALCACAEVPAVVRPADPVFARAQARLARSTAEARALAGGPDLPLFLQAESLYRYRFEARPKSAGHAALEAAALLTDVGPLEVLASDNGLDEVRLRTADAASQLYETLVARMPGSKLAPLALWRLGWAYRASTEQGDLSRGAFDRLAAAAPGTPLAALVPAARATPWRSQATATVLSIIPGAGQLYVGKPGEGALRLGVALGFTALTVLPALGMLKTRTLDWQRAALSTVGLVGLQLSYTLAFEDARESAIEFDERQEAAFEDAHPEAP